MIEIKETIQISKKNSLGSLQGLQGVLLPGHARECILKKRDQTFVIRNIQVQIGNQHMIIQEVLYQTILAGSTFSFICTDSLQAMSQNLWSEMYRELVNLHKHAVAFFLTDQTKIRKNQCLNKYQKDKSNARKDYIRHLLYIQKEAQQMEHV